MPFVSGLVLTLWLAAMFAYPGWSGFDPASTHYNFAGNFICDLLSVETPDGRSNRTGSLLMSAAVVILAMGGLLPVWWRVSRQGGLRTGARICGLLSVGLVLLVCVEQWLDLPIPHNSVTLMAGAAGLVPMAFAAMDDWHARDRTPTRRALLVGLLAAATTNFVGYAWAQLGGSLSRAVPTAQNLALLCLLAWLALKRSPPAT